jgi:hypothetical protein
MNILSNIKTVRYTIGFLLYFAVLPNFFAQNSTPAPTSTPAALSPSGFTYEAEAHLSDMRKLNKPYPQMVAEMQAYLAANTDQPRVAKRLNRWRFFWDNRVDADGQYNTYFNKMRVIAPQVCSSGGNTWTQVGPIIREADGSVQRQVSGIVTAIYSPPGTPNIIVAGSNTSGIWKTTNADATTTDVHWVCTTQNLRLSGLGISSIVASPDDPQTLYAISNFGSDVLSIMDAPYTISILH